MEYHIMEGVPVKISDQCRPPNKVHLPASLRNMPSSEACSQTYLFESEESATHWVQECRRNLMTARTERRKCLAAKDVAKLRKREEEDELARKKQEERQRHEEAERQQQEAEAARRQSEEEERLRLEEEARLEEFRLQRQRSQEAIAARAAALELDAVVAEGAEAGRAREVEEAREVEQPEPEPASSPAAIATDMMNGGSPPVVALAAAVPAPSSASSAVSTWSHPVAVATNTLSSLVRPAGEAMLTPQSWQQPGVAAAPRTGGFNYRDFESQASDPFDSAELKTINDMEELASVFQPPAAAPSNSQAVYSYQPDPCQQPSQQRLQSERQPQQQQKQSQSQQQLQHQQQSQHQGPHQPKQQQQQPQQQQQLQSQTQMQPQQQIYSRTGSSAMATLTGPARASVGYGFQPCGYQQYAASSYTRPTFAAPSTFTANRSPYRYAGYAYTSSGGQYAGRPASTTSATPSIAASSVGSETNSAPSAGYLAVPTGSSEAVEEAAAPADAQQLHEFYRRYYATPDRVGQSTAGATLRSSRSVPDLCEQVQRDDCGAARRTKSHTPPPQLTDGGEQSWSARVDPEVADPLQGLNPEVRSRLQELSQMGFPLDRLRRFYNQFNGDEKQVIEFSLSAQRLEEAGHSALAAEKGLLECDGDLGRAAEFLSSLAQLTGLGFPEPRATDALRRADMHRDRALDLLIQG